MFCQDSKTIHEAVFNSLRKTPQGTVYEKDLHEIFLMLLICLNLQEEPTCVGFLLRLVPHSKPNPYTFSLDSAIATMAELKVSIDLPSSTTTMLYDINTDLALLLVRRFYEASLLHSPGDRSRSTVSKSSVLQPTPKGVAILQDFCRHAGISSHTMPLILSSTFNSMYLFRFDRDPISDKIIYSQYLLHLLCIQLTGNLPNIWSPQNEPDELPDITDKLGTCERDEFIPTNTVLAGFRMSGCFNSDSKSVLDGGKQTRLSPFFHRYFTNPESDAYVQYYVSSVGVRVLESKAFKRSDGTVSVIKHCFTGKSLCQWLRDCTDTSLHAQAKDVGLLLMENGYIEPILDSPSRLTRSKFSESRNCYYRLGPMGNQACKWEKRGSLDVKTMDLDDAAIYEKLRVSSSSSSSDSDIDPETGPMCNPTLRQILRDPGMRYLFRKHLEKDLCVENLEAYLHLRLFRANTDALSRVLRTKRTIQDSLELKKVNQKASRLAKQSLSLAYSSFFSYLSTDAPYVVNIDGNLQQQITSVIRKQLYSDYRPRESPCEEVNTADLFFAIPNSSTALEPPQPPIPSDTAVVAQKAEVETTLPLQQQPMTLCSPTEQDIRETLSILVELMPIYERVMEQVYRMMEADSLPKFLLSSIFRNANASIKVKFS